MFAGGGKQIHAALRQLSGLGLRESPAVAHPNAVLHPAREGIAPLAIIDRRRGQSKATEPPGILTLHVQLHPLPPAQAVLGLAGPRPERAVLAGPRHVTDRNGRGVLQDNGIRPLGVAIAV